LYKNLINCLTVTRAISYVKHDVFCFLRDTEGVAAGRQDYRTSGSESGCGTFTPVPPPAGKSRCPFVITRDYILQADKQKEMKKKHLALSDNFGEMASRRDASPGRTARRPPLHSVRIASFDELARPFCCASTSHGRDAFRRNATGGGGRFFYRAAHPSGMQRCRGFFAGLSLAGGMILFGAGEGRVECSGINTPPAETKPSAGNVPKPYRALYNFTGQTKTFTPVPQNR
jgi:hypothetical protein